MSDAMNQALLLDIATAAVEACPADQTEAVCVESVQAVTRFANNVIHQNMADRGRELTVRAVVGRRIGVASGVISTADEARALARQAAELARLARELPDFVSLPSPQPIPPAPETFCCDCAASAARRAEIVKQVLETAAARGLKSAGALSTHVSSIAVVNSLGIRATRTLTRAHLHTVMQAEDSAGYAAAEGPSLADTRPLEVAETAAAKAELGRKPISLDPRPMTVLFEPVAAAELIEFMAFFGFNALQYQEQQSFACDLLGQQACAPTFTLTDDGFDPRTYFTPFDFEGVPKRRVELVKNGVVNALVYDSYTAARAKPPAENTGHALPAPNDFGPAPTNLVVSPGPASKQELIASIERGLLVSRIHYLNIVHPRQMILTGMTREGTFLIDKGELVAGVRNLRFTERMVQALGRLAGLGRDGELHGHVWLPPLVIEDFTFTSATEF